MFDNPIKKSPEKLRSARWFAPDDLRSFGHRSRMMQLGYAEEDFMGKPIIGVLNTWSEINSCHAHFRERAQDVKRGVAQAGGLRRRAAVALGRRELHQADLDALPQHAGDGGRGDDPQPPVRRRGADGRLRQDHARPRHGRDHRRRAVDLPARRADAARELCRAGPRLGVGRLEVLGRAPRRQHHATRNGSASRAASRARRAPA